MPRPIPLTMFAPLKLQSQPTLCFHYNVTPNMISRQTCHRDDLPCPLHSVMYLFHSTLPSPIVNLLDHAWTTYITRSPTIMSHPIITLDLSLLQPNKPSPSWNVWEHSIYCHPWAVTNPLTMTKPLKLHPGIPPCGSTTIHHSKPIIINWSTLPSW
jgi:hypothetical protein